MATFFVDISTTLVQLFVAGYIISRYIRPRSTLKFITLFALVLLSNYIFTGYVLDQVIFLRAMLTHLLTMILVLCMRQIPAVAALIYSMILLAFISLMELPTLFFCRLAFPDLVDVTVLTASELLLFRIMCIPFHAVSYAVPVWICNRIYHLKPTRETSRYIPFLLIQSIMLIAPIAIIVVNIPGPVSTVSGALYALANALLLVLLNRTFRQIDHTHELELQKEQAQSMLRAQIDYYNLIQDNVTALRQVRHDMKNQLQTLSILLDEGNLEIAQAQLAAYRAQLINTETRRFTGNSVLDAVLSAKVDACAQRGFPITCSGSIPTDIPVDPIHLCSIGANLLDNAIHACEALPPEIAPAIAFTAQIKEDRLLFTCRNPAGPGADLNPGAPDPTREHGWGLSILSRIAEDYGGQMQLTGENGWVCAALWMNIA